MSPPGGLEITWWIGVAVSSILVPKSEKLLVFDEIFRFLKLGGRLTVSDILAKRPLGTYQGRCIALRLHC